jgi:hypothetical protein
MSAHEEDRLEKKEQENNENEHPGSKRRVKN